MLCAISGSQTSVQPFAVDGAATEPEIPEQDDTKGADEEFAAGPSETSSAAASGPNPAAQLVHDLFLKRRGQENAGDQQVQPLQKKPKLDVARPLRASAQGPAEVKLPELSQDGDDLKVEKLRVTKAAKQSYIQAVCNGRKRLLVSVTSAMCAEHQQMIARLLPLAEASLKALSFRDLKQLLLEARTKLL